MSTTEENNNVVYSGQDRLLLAGEEIYVTDPQREGEGRDSFVTYKISVGEHSVRRRYNDFDSFRDALVKLNPTCVVPPLPEKQGFTVAQMQASISISSDTKPVDDADLIEGRRRLLESFVRRTAKHPILCASPLFLKFVEVESWSSALAEFQPALQNVAVQSKGWSGLTDKVHNPDPRFLDMQNYNFKFNQQCAAIDRVCRRLIRHQRELAGDIAELGGALTFFSGDEKDLADGIAKTGDAINNSFLTLRYMTMEVEDHLLDPLHEYALFGYSTKTVFKYYEQRHIEMETAQSNLVAERQKLNKLETTGNDGTIMGTFSRFFDSNPQKTTEDNIAKQRGVVSKAEQDVDAVTAEHTKISEAIIHDWNRFNFDKEKDYSRMLAEYANTQVDYYRRNCEVWESLVRYFDELP